MPSSDKYTDPELRDQVKQEIHESDKGGAPGQWSARKAQMMASEYKKRGGGYTTDKNDQDDSQKNLDKWTEEEWQTKEGSGHAKQEDGTEKRYLPKKAWEKMTDEEKENTEQKKLSQSRRGKQYVSNTSGAKQSRKEAEEEEEWDGEQQDERTQKDRQEPGDQDQEDQEGQEDGQNQEESEYGDTDEVPDDVSEEDDQPADEQEKGKDSKPQAGQKRKKAAQPRGKQTKTSKTSANRDVSEKDQDGISDDRRGSKDRLPKKGQEVEWRALPGIVQGTVVEVAYEDKEIEGKGVKASADEPRIVLRSGSSGKICVHKPEAILFV